MTENVRRGFLSRRGFLKAAGATIAVGAAAGSMSTAESWLAPAKAVAQPEERIACTYHNEHCLCNCVLQCTVRDGRLVMIQPRPNDDRRFQNVCCKGISEIQHIYGEARLQSPMKRVGERGSGEFEVISWDEAFQMIASAFKDSQEKYGKDSVWIQYSTEAQQRFTPLLADIINSATSIGGGHDGYDMGQVNGAFPATFVGPFGPNTIWDWENANVVLNMNCNILETGMMWSRGFLNAQRAGTKIISVDPRFSPTAAKSDQWVSIEPGTDPALFLAMINYVMENKLYDEENLIANTQMVFLADKKTGAVLAETAKGLDESTGDETKVSIPLVWDAEKSGASQHNAKGVTASLEGEFAIDGTVYETLFTRCKREMADYTLEWAEGITGIPADAIAQLAEDYAKGPSIINFGVGGIDKFYNGDVAGHCYALIATLTGNYGKAGTGYGIYGYHVSNFDPALGGWALPEGSGATHVSAFFDMVHNPDSNIHAAMFFGDIPTQKSANWNNTLDWINTLDFLCVADIYNSSVADFCDLVLPVCSKFECQDEVGGVKYANAHIMANLKVLDPLFESKSDFYIEKGIAEAMGYGDLYPADGVEFANAILTTDDPLVKGITLDTLKANNGAQRMNNTEDLIGAPVGMGCHTASGKAQPYYEELLEFGQAFPAWEAPQEAYVDNPLREKYPLQFGQSRTRFRVHSAYSGAQWIQQLHEPHIELNPADAESRGLKAGDKVEAFNDRGSFVTKLLINPAIRPGSAYMAESSYRQYLDGTLMQAVSNDNANERGRAQLMGPQIPFNDTLVEIKKAGA